MILPRRNFLRLAAGAAALPAVSRITRAESYPSRPVRLIVGFAAGGTQDLVARLIGQWLSDRLGQSILIENRTGGGGQVAIGAVAGASPDGYTLLLVGAPYAINAALNEKVYLDPLRHIAPVAGLTRAPLVMVVHPSFPAGSVPEFIAYAKANPGQCLFASGGNGTPQHMAGELFKMMAGVDMRHVPYRGEPPAIADLLGGQVQVFFGALPGTIAYIRSGKLRALAMASALPSPALPDVPTIGAFLPGYEASGWNGIGAPGNTPAEVIDKLNAAINAGLSDPVVNARLADLGAPVLGGSPTEFGSLIAEEIEKWAKVVRFAGLKTG